MKRRLIVIGLAAMSVLPLGLASQVFAVELTKAFSGQTINVLMGTGGTWDQYRSAAEQFSKETGINIEYVSLGYNEMYQKLVLDLTSGTGAYDAFVYPYQWKQEIAPYAADLVDSQSIEGAPSLELDDFSARTLDVYGRVGDKLVGLPILGDVTLFVWNKEQYKAAGLDPDVAPTTWEQVFENGQKLTKSGQYGFNLPAGKDAQTAVIWMILFASNGGEYFDASYHPLFNSDAGRKAMHFMVDKLQTIAPPGNLTWSFSEMLNGLTSGQSSQSLMWPGAMGVVLDPEQSTVSNAVGWAPMPGASLLGGWSMGVSNTSAHKEAALLYAAWIASVAVQRDAAAAGAAPARTSVLTDPELAKTHLYWPAVAAGMNGDVVEFPPVRESEQVMIMVYDAANAALSGQKTADQAVDDLQSQVEAFVKTAGYLK